MKKEFLLVDDGLSSPIESPLINRIINWLETKYGDYFNISVAVDVLDAFKIINNKSKIDVLFTDLNLPETGIPNHLLQKYYFGKVGGIYIVDEVFKINPKVNVIIATASDWDEFKGLVNENIIGRVMTKPFRLIELENVMEKIIKGTLEKD